MTPTQAKAMRVGQRVAKIGPQLKVIEGTVSFVGNVVIKVDWDNYAPQTLSFYSARSLHIMAEASHATL